MILCCQSTSPQQSATQWMIYGKEPSWTLLVSNSLLNSLVIRLTSKHTEIVAPIVNILIISFKKGQTNVKMSHF